MSDLAVQLDAAESDRMRTASEEPAQVADNSAASRTEWNSRLVRWIIIFGIVLVGAIIASTGVVLLDLRDRELAESERELKRLVFVLAEQIDRSFQSMELIQTAVIERMQSLGIASAEDYERQMSGYDTQQRLKDRISALPYIDAIVLTDPQGKLINFSRSWPIPSLKNPDEDFSEAFKSDPRLTVFVAKPFRSPATGNWVVPIARKLTGPKGEFLGVALGVMASQYFEQLFDAVIPTQNSSIALFRRDGTLLVRYPRQETAIGQSVSNSGLFVNLLSKSDHGTVRKIGAIDGKERLISARSLAPYPIVVVATTPVADAVAHWQSRAIYIAGSGVLMAFVVGGVVLLTGRQIKRRLRGQNRQFDAALNNISQGLVMFDSAARLVVCNDRYRQIYKFPSELLKPGCTVLDLLKYRVANKTFSGNPRQYVSDLLATIAHGKTVSCEMYAGDGHIIYVVNQPIAGGGFVSTHEDITERKRAKDELHRTQKFLDAVIEHVPVPIMVKDVPSSAQDARDCRFTLINRACEELFGVSRKQIIGKTADELYPKERADFIVARDNETLQSGQAILIRDHPVVTSSNGTRLVTAKKVAIRDDDGCPQYLLTVLDDITERRLSDARIVHMAHHDTLTDLPNRATFNDTMDATLDRAATTGKPFAVLSIDLDRFKEANDAYGHSVGDALLRAVAHRLQAAAEGAFIARIGGDEFALIVADDAQPAAAAALAERLLAAFVDDFEVEGHRLKFALSIGGAVYPTDGTDVKTLMINADAALYRVKAERRGSVLFFEPEMGARLRERRALHEDLRLAIDRDELLLHYQPQMKMSGETIGFEALIRWQCPKRGMVSPGTFIPIAEESSLIISVGEWVLRKACREAASWPQPLTIAVNVSPIQFRHGDLPRLVHSILLETGLAPARLELEITEGVLINDFSRAVSILRRLKSLGVQIALDDFGTGYSSLSYLHSFAFDKIKIDRAFIGDLEQNRHSMAIVRAVISLGRSLDLPILAEGVETEAQHAFLVQEGCDEVQGYLTGRPLPIADYAKLVGRQAIAQQNYATAG